MADEATIEIDLDGETIVVDPLDINGVEWADIKRHLGMRPKVVLDAIAEFDFDALAALIWVMKRRDAPADQVKFDEILSGLSMRSFIDTSDGEAGDADPSDSGADSEA